MSILDQLVNSRSEFLRKLIPDTPAQLQGKSPEYWSNWNQWPNPPWNNWNDWNNWANHA